MKQTAVEKMIQYFIEQKNNGVSHWCINDLLGQLQQAKAMEKEQIIESWDNGYANGYDLGKHDDQPNPDDAEQYYNETYEQDKQG